MMKKEKTYLMNPSAMSPEGYIIHQGKLTGISFGCRTSDYNGCGWISAYNLLHYLTGTQDWETICKDMERYVVFRGLLGVNFFGLWRYLHRKGCRFSLTFTCRGTQKRWEKLCQSTRRPCGIMLYFHKRGGHYVTFTSGEGNCLHFYNLRYGLANDQRTLPEVYKTHVFFPLTFTLIYRGISCTEF